MKQNEIVEYFIQKYNPLAIYLSGSRARGKERLDSDWDMHLVVRDDKQPVSEKLSNTSLDVKYIPESRLDESLIDTPYSPAVPFRILYRKQGYEQILLDLENRTLAAYEKGPIKWSDMEYEDNRTRLQRFLEAIQGTTNNELICFRHFCKLFDLALVYWFRLRGEWSIPIYEAIDEYKFRDIAFYEALVKATTVSDMKSKAGAADVMFKSLFKKEKNESTG